MGAYQMWLDDVHIPVTITPHEYHGVSDQRRELVCPGLCVRGLNFEQVIQIQETEIVKALHYWTVMWEYSSKKAARPKAFACHGEFIL